MTVDIPYDFNDTVYIIQDNDVHMCYIVNFIIGLDNLDGSVKTYVDLMDSVSNETCQKEICDVYPNVDSAKKASVFLNPDSVIFFVTHDPINGWGVICETYAEAVKNGNTIDGSNVFYSYNQAMHHIEKMEGLLGGIINE